MTRIEWLHTQAQELAYDRGRLIGSAEAVDTDQGPAYRGTHAFTGLSMLGSSLAALAAWLASVDDALVNPLAFV